jgi:heptosyltransferase-3
MYRYKAWHDSGWNELIEALRQRGLQVVISGGPSERERAHAARLLQRFDGDPQVIDCCGRLSFAELTPLLERAAVYVGPDTSVTHLAAACGTPTVALYGPSNPSAWGPWPFGYSGPAPSPWVHTAPLQQINNVWLLQGQRGRYGACIPCMQEGCERNHDSPADCLDTLQAGAVIAAVEQALRSCSRTAAELQFGR